MADENDIDALMLIAAANRDMTIILSIDDECGALKEAVRRDARKALESALKKLSLKDGVSSDD